MLPRGKRLTRATFGRAQAGKRAATRHFSVSVAKSTDGRAAAVISKKVAKKSVDRHLLKRRVLDIAAPYVLPGRSFVVFARAGSPELSFPALKTELEELLTNLPRV